MEIQREWGTEERESEVIEGERGRDITKERGRDKRKRGERERERYIERAREGEQQYW